MNLRRAQPSESRELAAWIQERHYSDSGPAGYRYALEFRIDRDRVGGMLLGRPSGRGLDPELWLELSRVYFIDETPVNVESRGLAMMRRFVRVWVPRTRGLVAYSDPNQGHEGTIYAADGWAPFGTTKNGRSGWKNRSGRSRGDKPSRKQRWVRTP